MPTYNKKNMSKYTNITFKALKKNKGNSLGKSSRKKIWLLLPRNLKIYFRKIKGFRKWKVKNLKSKSKRYKVSNKTQKHKQKNDKTTYKFIKIRIKKSLNKTKFNNHKIS